MGIHCSKSKTNFNSLPHTDSMRFKLSIRNLKLKANDLKMPIPSFLFSVPTIFQISTESFKSTKIDSGTFHWNFNKTFEFALCENDLKKSNFSMILINDRGKKIYKWEIPLIEIASGPAHHDIAINIPKSKDQFRVIFNMKMSQMIRLLIEPMKMRIKMTNPLQSESYNFSMKVLIHDRVEEGVYSRDYVNPSNSPIKEKELEIVEAISKFEATMKTSKINESPTKKQKPLWTKPSRSQSVQIEEELEILQKNIYWDHQSQSSLEIELDSNEIPHATLQILLWSVKKSIPVEESAPKHSKENFLIKFIDNTLVAEAFVSLKKLFRDDFFSFQLDKQKSFVVAERAKFFRETMVQKGVDVGRIDGELHIVSQPFIQQMICGLRTESGITKSRMIFQNSSSKKEQDLPPEIKEIQVLSASLEDLVYEISSHEKKHSESKYSVLSKQAIIKTMELRNHLKKSLSGFNYLNKSHLLESQESLISLTKRLIKYIDELSQELQNTCYELLREIVLRKEFDLSSMGFDSLQESLKTKATSLKLKNSENLRHFKSQISVAQKYEKFLYDCLGMVLNKIDDLALSAQELNFVASFLAIAFFRIPLFRKKLLHALPIHEKTMNMRSSDIAKASNTYFMELFDWEGEFYEVLNEDKRSQESKEILNEVIEKYFSAGAEKFTSKDLIFHFTSEYFKYIQRTIHSKEMMPWSYLPGYSSITSLFLSSLNNYDFENLPQSLIDAISSFLPDENLFKRVFTIILFSINDYVCCERILSLIDKWFEEVGKNGKKLPTSLNTSMLSEKLRNILKGEHCMLIMKSLGIVYNNFYVFPSFL